MEERDKYFTSLKETIEELRQQNNLPVAVIAHSMGNRVFHYFLNWIKLKVPLCFFASHFQDDGEKWLEDNIHTFIAVGAPWLGAPKSLRGLVTGERMGLEALLDREEALMWGRTLGSTLCLLPIGLNYYFDSPDKSITFLKDTDGIPKPISMQETLRLAGAEVLLPWPHLTSRNNGLTFRNTMKWTLVLGRQGMKPSYDLLQFNDSMLFMVLTI